MLAREIAPHSRSARRYGRAVAPFHGGLPPRQAAPRFQRKEHVLQILVRNNDVDQALKVLKKRLQREGVFRELRRKRFYEKPSERRAREKGEAVRRQRKLARKKLQREGVLPAPKRKPRPTGAGRSAGPPRF
jgi:small subunit ribosomal protein S21